MKGYVYILLCEDGSYYTGSTRNLDIRLRQHFNAEGSRHTRRNKPVQLVYCEEFRSIVAACQREREIHGWRREKKEALIKLHMGQLPKLAMAYWHR